VKLPGVQRPLPEYVLKEFEAYLKCGLLAHGFIRLKCEVCSEETVVAFSCKKRRFCPSKDLGGRYVGAVDQEALFQNRP